MISAEDALAGITTDNFAFASFNEAVPAVLDALGLVIVPDPQL